MKPFTIAVIEQIKRIPKGNVMTYGQIAKAAGSPRAARQVVRILHLMSEKHQLPWHRVINAKGEIAIKERTGFIRQKKLLEQEGVSVSELGHIDLATYQFHDVQTLDGDWDTI